MSTKENKEYEITVIGGEPSGVAAFAIESNTALNILDVNYLRKTYCNKIFKDLMRKDL